LLYSKRLGQPGTAPELSVYQTDVQNFYTIDLRTADLKYQP